MPEPRTIAHADESTQRTDGTFYLQYITENEPGYTPGIVLYPTLQAAQDAAAWSNHHLTPGLTPTDILEIRLSSMAAGPVQR